MHVYSFSLRLRGVKQLRRIGTVYPMFQVRLLRAEILHAAGKRTPGWAVLRCCAVLPSGAVLDHDSAEHPSQEVDFGINSMSGTIPESIGNSQKLRFLYLGYNNFTGLSTTGCCSG